MDTGKKVGIAVVAVLGGVGLGYLFYKHSEKAVLFAQFRKWGDVNGDGVIDSKDLTLLQALYLTTPDSPNWNPYADLDGNGIVDAADIFICSQHQGLTYALWLKTKGYSRTRGHAKNYTVQTTIVPVKEI